MTISEKIAELRRQQGWSQEELAERMNVSRQSVSKWESGASTPELDRIVQLCELFGVTADALIREDLTLDGRHAEPLPRLSLQQTYAYAAESQTIAHKMAMGVAAFVASPAVTAALSFSDPLCELIGLPILFLLVAWGVWMCVNASSLASRYQWIRKGQFCAAPDAVEWARSAKEQFHPRWVRELAAGIVLCVLSVVPLPMLSVIAQILGFGAELGECFGSGALLLIVAAGVFFIVRSCMMQNCYRRLLKEADI